MVIQQGDVFFADLGGPRGSKAGFVQPVIVVQSNQINQSRLSTVIVVPCTSNLKWAEAPGNVRLRPRAGLRKPSVANVSLVSAIDRATLGKRIAQLTKAEIEEVFMGIALMLGRSQ